MTGKNETLRRGENVPGLYILGVKAKGRKVIGADDMYEMREGQGSYNDVFGSKKCTLRLENAYFLNGYPDNSI